MMMMMMSNEIIDCNNSVFRVYLFYGTYLLFVIKRKSILEKGLLTIIQSLHLEQELVFGLWLRLINSLAHSKYVASDSLTLLQVKGKKEEDMLDHYDQSVDKGDGEGEGGDGSWGRDSQESTLLLGGGGQSDGGKRVVRDEEYRTVHRLFFNQKIAFEVTAGLCYLALLLLRFPLPLFKFVHSLAMEEIPYSTAFSELPHFTDIWLLRPQAPPSCRRIYHVTWALAVLTLGNTFTLPPASFELYWFE